MVEKVLSSDTAVWYAVSIVPRILPVGVLPSFLLSPVSLKFPFLLFVFMDRSCSFSFLIPHCWLMPGVSLLLCFVAAAGATMKSCD